VEASHARVRAQAAAEEAERHERERLLEAQAAAERMRAEAERRNVSRLRVFLMIGGALLVAMVGLAVFAAIQWNEADQQTAQAEQQQRLAEKRRALADAQSKTVRAQLLATNAEEVFPAKPLLGLRMVLEGLKEIPPDAPARAAILQGEVYRQVARAMEHDDAPEGAVDWWRCS
jgi:hypothetical protein